MGPSARLEGLHSAALIVIDMQKDFLDPDGYWMRVYPHLLGDDGGLSMIEANKRAINAMRRAGRPIIFVKVVHRPDHRDQALSPIYLKSGPLEGNVEGTEGSGLVDGLDCCSNEFELVKKWHGAFVFTHLDRLLTNLRVTDCIYTGGGAGGCVTDTVYQGDALGYRQWLVDGAIYPVEDGGYLDVLKGFTGATTVDELDTLAYCGAGGSGPRAAASSHALLLLGFQNQLFEGDAGLQSASIEERRSLVDAVAALISEARAKKWPIIHSLMAGRADGADWGASANWPALAPGPVVRDTRGADLVDGIEIQSHDIVVERTTPSAFAFTPLLRILRNLSINHLYIAGGDVQQAISSTIRDAAAAGYEITILEQFTYPANDPYLPLISNRAVISAALTVD